MVKKKIIPPIDYLQTAATSILSDSDPFSIKNKLNDFISHYDALTIGISYDDLLWRARKAEDKSGYSNLAKVYYPPIEETKPGRLNEAKNPLLYVSFNQFTTLTEIHANKGDYIHFIGYSMKNSKTIRVLILGEFFYGHKGGQGNLAGNFNEWMHKTVKKMDHEPRLSFVFMDAFLSSLVADERASENEYLHTRILAKILFEKYPNIDAIYYPSVMSNGAMNLAIKTNVADEVLEAKDTRVLQIKNNFDYGLFRFSRLKQSKEFDKNGNILW